MLSFVCPACGIASDCSELFTDPSTLNQECPNCGVWSHQDDWSESHGYGDPDPSNPENYDLVQD